MVGKEYTTNFEIPVRGFLFYGRFVWGAQTRFLGGVKMA
jgi:hypothetical protein